MKKKNKKINGGGGGGELKSAHPFVIILKRKKNCWGSFFLKAIYLGKSYIVKLPVVKNQLCIPACRVKFLLTRIYSHTSCEFLISAHFSILHSHTGLILPEE